MIISRNDTDPKITIATLTSHIIGHIFVSCWVVLCLCFSRQLILFNQTRFSNISRSLSLPPGSSSLRVLPPGLWSAASNPERWLPPWPPLSPAAGGWRWRRSSRTCCSPPCCWAGDPCSSCSSRRASTPTCAKAQVRQLSVITCTRNVQFHAN